MRNGQDWWFGSTSFCSVQSSKAWKTQIWQAFQSMFECSHAVPGWNDESKEEIWREEEDIWRVEGPKMCPTYTLSIKRHNICLEIFSTFFQIHGYSASQSNMFVKLLWLECRYMAKAVWLDLFSSNVNTTAEFGIAGEGKSSFVERSIAKFRRTSGASRHVVSCHNKHATTISAIRRSVEARGGTSIRGVKWCEAARISLEMTDSLLRPGDHDDLGGVEKAEDSQCRHGGPDRKRIGIWGFKKSQVKTQEIGPRRLNNLARFFACFLVLSKGDYRKLGSCNRITCKYNKTKQY